LGAALTSGRKSVFSAGRKRSKSLRRQISCACDECRRGARRLPLAARKLPLSVAGREQPACVCLSGSRDAPCAECPPTIGDKATSPSCSGSRLILDCSLAVAPRIAANFAEVRRICCAVPHLSVRELRSTRLHSRSSSGSPFGCCRNSYLAQRHGDAAGAECHQGEQQSLDLSHHAEL
jgi:hypothetical protein